MYKHFIKPILFRFNPETAHNFTFSALSFLRHVPFARSIIRSIYKKESPKLAREVFGINFPNPVGLAGGLAPGSPVPGILQARTLEWVAISFSNA